MSATPPKAVVQRQGRWAYLVQIHDGPMQWGPGGYGWVVWGRRRAERKARRVLAKYLLQQRRGEEQFVVSAEAVPDAS